jgi:predicted RNA-binding protein associated with RNAse of E/G family
VTIQQFIADLDAVEAVVAQGLATASAFDPGLAAPEAILAIVEQLVGKALTAWSNASGQEITVETLTALLPNTAPLDKPTA